MNTLRRITNRLRDEWDYATPLARLAMVAALPQARPFGVYTVANGRAIMAWSVSK